MPEENDETATLMNSLAKHDSRFKIIISDIDSNLSELSNGEFLITVDDNFKGDFAEISQSFRGIIKSLSATMRDINSNAESVQNGAMDLSEASQVLAEGATDQASAVEELTATITEFQKNSCQCKKCRKNKHDCCKYEYSDY